MKYQREFKVFRPERSLLLECGAELPDIRIAYNTYGTLNESKDNCIWVCHALTADSDVADWWPHTVVKDGFLDPERYFIVCANIIGSCYGSTGPLSEKNPEGEIWYDEFPALTIRDMVRAHIMLADFLGIHNIFSLIGSSVGGFQAIEWAVEQPKRFKSLVLIATAAKSSPWAIALDETQRMAIFADATYGEKREDAGSLGLAAARAIGLLSYRGPSGYNLSQQNKFSVNEVPHPEHRACSYQRYQGKKLVDRFDAYSYVAILNAFDTHDAGRGRGGLEKALSRLKMPVLVIGITTDIVFTPPEMRRLADMIPGSEYKEMESDFGHDGFLVEHEALNNLIKEFFEKIR